ncbi:helix-turn-helix domain-containing protein [Streptomyces sp. NPDC048312]|uniref:PucR family transcriptional regulator n=1 Tax=Streptomyces sp. NPDC048312 TaxID=3155485 RepID=UPI0033E35E26
MPDRAGEGACRDDLGTHGVLLGAAARDEPDRFVRRTTGPLVEHDETRGSDPVRTALACFTCDGNLSRTASALCVHVNTLYQRMDRISRCSARGGATATTRCRSIWPSPCGERPDRAASACDRPVTCVTMRSAPVRSRPRRPRTGPVPLSS